MDKRDEAIIELAHVADCLLEYIKESHEIPGVFQEAIENKIDYYRRMVRNENG